MGRCHECSSLKIKKNKSDVRNLVLPAKRRAWVIKLKRSAIKPAVCFNTATKDYV